MTRGNEENSKSNDTHWQTRFIMERVLDGQWWQSLTLTHWQPENGINISHATHDEMETVLDGQPVNVQQSKSTVVDDFLQDLGTYTSVPNSSNTVADKQLWNIMMPQTSRMVKKCIIDTNKHISTSLFLYYFSTFVKISPKIWRSSKKIGKISESESTLSISSKSVWFRKHIRVMSIKVHQKRKISPFAGQRHTFMFSTLCLILFSSSSSFSHSSFKFLGIFKI